METRIIEALLREGRPMSPEALMECFEYKDEAASAIEKLILEGRLILTRKRKLALPEQTGLIYGRVQGSARGYGFFIPEAGGGDMFIPADAMHGAMHNDMVWARAAETSSHNGTQEAEVAMIAIRAHAVIVGTYELDGSEGGYVVPDEPRVCFDMLIGVGHTLGAKNGDKVVAKITRYPDGRRPMLGEITEILGARDDARADMLSIIRRLELPDVFPKAATKQAKALNKPVPEDAIALREDLRGKLIVTIDGADAKDLDDAVSLTKLADGWILGVHIADVSAYVAEGTPLDEEAYRRGTSVYFPDRVLPMFPAELSNGACSLNEGEDKLTFSCIMRLDAEGKPVSHRMADTVIRSAHRMTYDDVNAMLDGDASLCEKYADVLPMLTDMKELAAILHEKRVKRGCLDFDLDEADITLDAEGRAVDVKAAVRGISNRMIEEFMLEANETVAAHAAAAGIPMMYRVHETPDKDKLNELNVFLNTLGLGVRSMGSGKPALLQKILLRAKGTKDETLVARVMLRSMKKARYAGECLGHYGLAAEYYCHFTSPIRRYPDLVVHRMMKLLLSGGMSAQVSEKYDSAMEEMARRCSDRELVAMEAERAADDLKKCEYMASRIGSVEKGIISGVAQYGFFVRLGNTVEGMVRAASLAGDYFECDERRYRLVGRNTGRGFRLGDEARVRVIAVDVGAGTIDFELANGTRGGTSQSAPAEKPARKPKKPEPKRRLARGRKS
ncbi:MAG: Ribonuclease R [Firmicutes bacterium ADurb.Bin248]|nr:MAG: Ribonuclease R [Firmicutes bacterium ADurb.Bin248]